MRVYIRFGGLGRQVYRFRYWNSSGAAAAMRFSLKSPEPIWQKPVLRCRRRARCFVAHVNIITCRTMYIILTKIRYERGPSLYENNRNNL